MERSDSLTNISKSLLAFQKKMPTIAFDSENPHFKSKYASLSAIMKSILPLLNEAGCIVVHTPELVDDSMVEVETVIYHVESGEFISCKPKASSDGSPQKVGSAITYLRRYGLSAVLGIVTEEDDDGNVGSGGKDKTDGKKDKKATKKADKTDEDRTQSDRAAENRVKIGNMLMDMTEGDKVLAADLLEGHTKWMNDEGKEFPGKRSAKDLSDKATFPVMLKIEKAHAAWHGDKTPAEPAEEQPDLDMDRVDELKASVRELGEALGKHGNTVKASLNTSDEEALENTRKAWQKELNERGSDE